MATAEPQLPHKIDIPHTDKFPPILIVSNLWDPATPNPMAMNLLWEIGAHRARLLTREASGHTILFQANAYDGPNVAAMKSTCLS